MSDSGNPCAVCRGACCEDFQLPGSMRPLSRDARNWLELHGERLADGALRFECRCRALSASGRCTVYDQRPAVCRQFAVGGHLCLATISRRRSSRDAELVFRALGEYLA